MSTEMKTLSGRWAVAGAAIQAPRSSRTSGNRIDMVVQWCEVCVLGLGRARARNIILPKNAITPRTMAPPVNRWRLFVSRGAV
jgi:hypothetical protein